MKLKPEKNIGRLEPGIRAQVVCMVVHIFTCIDHHLLPWAPEVFLSLQKNEMSGEAARASRKAATKNISNSQNDQLLDGLMAQLVEDCIGIAQVKI